VAHTRQWRIAIVGNAKPVTFVNPRCLRRRTECELRRRASPSPEQG